MIIYLVLFSLLKSTFQASVPVTWTSSSYFVCGTFTYVPTYMTVFNQTVYIPYTTAMSGANRLVTTGIINFDYQLSDPIFTLIIINPYISTTGFWINVTYNVGTYILSGIKMAYLTVDPIFTEPFSITYFTVWMVNAPLQGPFAITYYVNFTQSTGVILNLSNDNGMLAFQHIINVTSTALCFNIDIIFRVFNSSFYEVTISTYCNMIMSQFGFSRIIFDRTAIQNLGFCYFQYGQLRSTNGNTSPLTFTINPLFTRNFMMGMKSFNVSGIPSIKFSTSIGTTTSVSSTSAYSYLSFMYWSFKLRVCPAGYPYFIATTLLCYDICPDGMFGNNTSLMCQQCHYSCLTCSDFATCITCNTTTANRHLNGTSCPPNYGYYDNLTVITLLCSAVLNNCQACINNVTCTNCISGYYVNMMNTCQLCNASITYCLNCTGPTPICTLCNTGYVISGGGSTCIFNPCTDKNCQSCPVDVNICTVCVTGTGYHLVGNSCVTLCGDGIIAGTEQCDDNNTADGDGCNADCTTGNNNGCPKATPYKDPVTLTCVSACPSRFYPNATDYTCLACNYTCLTCTNSTDCVTCSSANNRQLIGTTCPPLPGFYDNNLTDALPCVSPCVNCTSASACLSCVIGYYLSGTSCTTCSTITPFCKLCSPDGSICLTCQLGYIFNSTTSLCDVVPCNDMNCLACPSSKAFCEQCTLGYVPINGVCTQICGDFTKINDQQCDDGNSISKDGCSADCKVEPDFTCQPDLINSLGSACFYIGQIAVDLKYMNKVDGKNQLQVVLDIFPDDLAFWDDVNFIDMMQVQSPVPISGVNIQRNSDGTVTVTFQYSENIQGKNISVSVDPSKSGIPALMRAIPSFNSMIVNPNDNEAADFYDESVYRMSNIVSLLCTAISGLSLALFFLGLISGKMIGVQMMAVVQISFFALVTLSQVNPCFAALSSLKFVNGYNSLSSNQLEDKFNPNQPKGIFLFSRFLQNFNFTTAVVLVPLLVALVCFILSKTAFKNNKKVILVFERALGQYTLNGLLFSGYLISVSFALQVLYGIKNTSDLIGKISLGECSIFLALLIGYFVFLILKPSFFGEFTDQFKKDSTISAKYYNIMIVQRIIVGSLLIILLSIKMEGIIPIVVFVLLTILVIIKRPYKRVYNNLRVVANMVISSVVLAIYLFYKMSSEETKHNSSIFFYLPLAVCGLLILCIFYNIIAIIYTIYQRCKKNDDVQQMDRDQFKQVVKLGKQAILQGTFSPTLQNTQELNGTEQLLQDKKVNIRKKVNLKQIKKSIKMNKQQPEVKKSYTNNAANFEDNYQPYDMLNTHKKILQLQPVQSNQQVQNNRIQDQDMEQNYKNNDKNKNIYDDINDGNQNEDKIQHTEEALVLGNISKIEQFNFEEYDKI